MCEVVKFAWARTRLENTCLDTDVKAGIEPGTTAAEKMSSGLVPLVFLVNLLVFGLLLAYSFLNLLPGRGANEAYPEQPAEPEQ